MPVTHARLSLNPSSRATATIPARQGKIRHAEGNFASGAEFRDFLAALRPLWLCVPCLAKVSEQPELPIRQTLQVFTDQLEARTGECGNCAETGQTYRIRESAA